MTTNASRMRDFSAVAQRAEAGFSLVELLVATGLLLMVSSIVTQALLQMTQQQATIWNRTEMHSGIRGATELLQQEVGQAGRISLPTASAAGKPLSLVLTADITNPANGVVPPACDPGNPGSNAANIGVQFVDSNGAVVTSVPGILTTTGAYGTVNPLSFLYAGGAPAAYELVTTLDGEQAETIKINSVDVAGSTINACYTKTHLQGTVLMPMGAFANGVLPDSGLPVGEMSDASTLKLFGDINGDGNLVYIEYKCDTANGVLTRNVMAYNANAKIAGNAQVLLANVTTNPGGTPCFSYQTFPMKVQGTWFYFVLDVAVTLTVQSEQIDPITKQKQTETKALLNVSPRNIFGAWELASIGYTDRIQSTPASIKTLLP